MTSAENINRHVARRVATVGLLLAKSSTYKAEGTAEQTLGGKMENNEADTNMPENAENPAQAEQGQESSTQQQQGRPDAQRAAEGYRAQRDEARAERDRLRKQLDELQAKGDPEVYKKQLEEALEKAKSDAEKAEFKRVNSVRLIKEGCVDVDVALTLLDENGDVEALKAQKPYLFEASEGSTGFKPSGQASDRFEAIDKAMGVKR